MDLRHPLRRHLLRDRTGRHAVPARRLAAVRGGRHRGAARNIGECTPARRHPLRRGVAGDSCNYTIGRFFGRKLFADPNSRIFKRSHLDKTHAFYRKYGGKTIVLARFVPIVRTFAPFVAGMGRMHYTRFMAFNLLGGAAWIALFCYAGYLFGDLPFVQQNLRLLIVAIVFVSLLPAVAEVVRSRRRTRNA